LKLTRPIAAGPAAAALLVLPLAVNLPLLSPWLTADPIVWMSNLAFVQPGSDTVLPGFPGWADGNAGVTTEALGRLAADDWLRGEVPWWNPYGGVGLPLAAEMQNSALFLPFVLLLHLPHGVLLLKTAMQALTGLASFALFRTLGIALPVALFCAALAEFNGTFAWYAHGPIMPVAFLPLLLLGIERSRLAALAGQRRGWAVTAIAIAGSIYAGFPETAFLDGLLGLAFAVARLATLPRRDLAPAFAGKIVCGGLCGLLLSAPAAWPFLDFLRHAYLSVHADYSFSHLLPGSTAMLLVPYIFGTILFGNLVTGAGQEYWWHAGGYLGLPLVFLALFCAVGRGRERTLRLVLAGWIALTFLKAAGVPPVARLFDLIPFVRNILFPVYIAPSWELAAILLAALALDDWTRGRVTRAAAPLAAALAGLLAATATRLAWPEIDRLAGATPLYLWIAIPSLCMSGGAGLLAALCIARPCTTRRFAGLCVVLGAEALANYTVPFLSAVHPRALDNGPVAFLRTHLGLQRFYSEAAIAPNYGAYYRLASVNHRYLPVPLDWVDHLHAQLSRTMDGVEFFGPTLRPGAEFAGLAEQIAHDPSSAQAARVLADLGVAYLVVPHGVDPLEDTIGPAISLHGNRPLALAPSARATLELPPIPGLSGRVDGAGIDIGTYDGQADGALTMRLCFAGDCREARTPLRGATDNGLLWFAFDRPLPVPAGPGPKIAVTLRHEGGGHDVALWLWPSAAPDSGARPALVLRYRPSGPTFSRVYADPLVDILSVPGPAPYYGAAGADCRLQARDRLAVVSDCAAPGRLVRRELFFPGWRARLNGHPVPIARAQTIFQSVALPPGRATIEFRYAPPGIEAATLAMLAGLVWLTGSRLMPGRRPSAETGTGAS
jgi:hypothetical protein